MVHIYVDPGTRKAIDDVKMIGESVVLRNQTFRHPKLSTGKYPMRRISRSRRVDDEKEAPTTIISTELQRGTGVGAQDGNSATVLPLCQINFRLGRKR